MVNLSGEAWIVPAAARPWFGERRLRVRGAPPIERGYRLRTSMLETSLTRIHALAKCQPD
jgi:hypothetical protein